MTPRDRIALLAAASLTVACLLLTTGHPYAAAPLFGIALFNALLAVMP